MQENNPKEKNKPMRTAFIRVSATNHITKDNDELGIKAGSVVNYTMENILDIIDEWQKTKKFNYFVIEHNSTEENKHWHIVLSFANNSTCTFNTIKNKFPLGFIDSCKTGVKNCVRYMCHADHPEKVQYPWESIITNAPDKLESYKIPGNNSVDIKVQQTYQAIINGDIKEYEIEKIEPELYIKYRTKIKNAFEYRQQSLQTNPNRNIEVYVLQGPPRIGKTTFVKVWAMQHNKTVCFSSASRDPWQDYSNQSCFVYDDFDCNSIKIEDFKKALDPHTSTTMSRRYKNVLFTGDTIFICTNTPIIKWFPYDNDSSREAVFKRISYVLDFKTYDDIIKDPYYKPPYLDNKVILPYKSSEDANGVAFYTVNKIELLDSWTKVYKGDKYINTYRDSELVCVDKLLRKFDLNKYVDIHADKKRELDFLKQIGDI